jgi:hypothetical protein
MATVSCLVSYSSMMSAEELAASKATGRATLRALRKINFPASIHVGPMLDGTLEVRVCDATDFFAGPIRTYRRARMVMGIMPHVLKKVRQAANAAAYKKEIAINLNPWAGHEVLDWRFRC